MTRTPSNSWNGPNKQGQPGFHDYPIVIVKFRERNNLGAIVLRKCYFVIVDGAVGPANNYHED
jgi:hypothetical protein